jgi:hypothetical protein
MRARIAAVWRPDSDYAIRELERRMLPAVKQVERTGVYAGCAWLVVAALLALGAYVGLGLAGPSAIPIVLVYLVFVALALGLAAAMWTGAGGRNVAILSLILGVVFAVIGLRPWGPDPTFAPENIGAALFGVAIALTSAYALRGYPGPTSRD